MEIFIKLIKYLQTSLIHSAIIFKIGASIYFRICGTFLLKI